MRWSDEVRTAWDRNAAFWDARMGEGNSFHKQLIEPSTDRLLDLRAGERVLELACGNGQYARHMAATGAHVTATDLSGKLIELARARSVGSTGDLEFAVMDATDPTAYAALGEAPFDAVVCGMALMDIPQIEPVFVGAAAVLKPGGRFVFSLMHPCFNSNGAPMVVERDDLTGEVKTTAYMKVSRYLTPFQFMGVAMQGQPAAHPYFHRPLCEVLGACFAAGFVVDGIKEPSEKDADESRPFSWSNFPEIPPVLIIRARIQER